MFIGYRISSRNFIKYSESHELRAGEVMALQNRCPSVFDEYCYAN